MYLITDMWYKKVQVTLGLIKRENLIVSSLPSASESRLLYPASSFKVRVRLPSNLDSSFLNQLLAFRSINNLFQY